MIIDIIWGYFRCCMKNNDSFLILISFNWLVRAQHSLEITTKLSLWASRRYTIRSRASGPSSYLLLLQLGHNRFTPSDSRICILCNRFALEYIFWFQNGNSMKPTIEVVYGMDKAWTGIHILELELRWIDCALILRYIVL